jgi:hypothetical protein
MRMVDAIGGPLVANLLSRQQLRSILHFYFTFWASTAYVPFVPIGGVDRELFFDDAVSNQALIALRRFIFDFIEIERFEPDTPQIWQWERNIET